MNQDTLKELGLTPAATRHIIGNRRTRLINFLLRWEEYEGALACVEEMMAFYSGLVTLHDAKARALLGLGQPDAALEVMHARHERRISQTSRSLEARIQVDTGDTERALGIARELVESNPDSPPLWGLLGEVQLAGNDDGAAVDAYRRLAELRPNSRAYFLGMLAVHEARGDLVGASGYAVRLQRSTAADRPLPAATLRRLRDYFGISRETNRAEEMAAALAARYETELAELREALGEDLKVWAAAAAPPRERRAVPAAPGEEPEWTPDTLPVSKQERQRVEAAAKAFFGFQRLLPGQVETMAATLRDQDVLTILPTGGGKSLCYQLPALLEEDGTTLVISPLIALMKDQVDSLPSKIRSRATTIDSTLDGSEMRRRMRDAAAGRYRLVYAAPERLRQPPFLHALRRAGVKRLVIDEAHCVSVWGRDFRPDYMAIAKAHRSLGRPTLLGMTATAPPRVRHDVLQHLSEGAADPDGKMVVVSADVYRPNLHLSAVRAGNADEKLCSLLALIQSEAGSAIVYAGTRARCEEISALLRDQGISAGFYHAGMGGRAARTAAQDDLRTVAQDDFMGGRVRVMVATVAFGMGIDKADIRLIVHLQLPPSLEAYYQEAGRAGRDGKPARCVLIFSTHDRGTLTRRARRDSLPVEYLRQVYAAVKQRIGEGTTVGRIAADDLMRDLQSEVTPLRVALSMLEEAGLVCRHHDIPRTAVVRLVDGTPAATGEADWSAFVSAARLRPGQSLQIDLMSVARASGLDPTGIEFQLLDWAEAGRLEYHGSGRELLLELLPAPADAAARVQTLIDRYATIQVQRVDEIAAYAATRRCRHGHISAYLGGRPMESCDACDICRPDSSPAGSSLTPTSMPSESEQLATILRCAANARWGWGRANLANILCGNSRASERGQASPEWRVLAFRSQAALGKMIDRLAEAGLLDAKQLDHGGVVLELTPAGRAALENPAGLASLVAGP
jgi:ATP-dependent DNA helicase RecQ